MVKLLHQTGASMVKPKRDGMTIFHVAASHNDIHTLDYCISSKVSRTVDLKNEEVYFKF